MGGDAYPEPLSGNSAGWHQELLAVVLAHMLRHHHGRHELGVVLVVSEPWVTHALGGDALS